MRRRFNLEHYGVLLANLAERLGPTAIKVAQIASTRPDLLPCRLIAPLVRMQEMVTPISKRKIIKEFSRAFPNEPGTCFSSIDWNPIASGSIAVVLRGKTLDGQQVALKLVRPGVRGMIEKDLQIFSYFVRLLSKVPRMRAVPVVEAFELFAIIVRKQCDMQNEASNLYKLRGVIGPKTIIPKVDLALTKANVLVMEFLNDYHSIVAPHHTDTQYEAACLDLLHEVYRMVFVHGLVHGDLHPGNVGIAASGKLILVDFGLLAEISLLDRRRFRNLFLSVATGDGKLAAIAIIESTRFVPDDLDITAFEKSVRDLISRRTKQTAGEFLVVEFASEIFAIQKRYGMFGAPGFANAIWALAMYEGLVRSRLPHLNFQKEALKFVMAPYANTQTVEYSNNL